MPSQYYNSFKTDDFRLNLGKNGISASIGGRLQSGQFNLSKHGTHSNVEILGIGISFSATI